MKKVINKLVFFVLFLFAVPGRVLADNYNANTDSRVASKIVKINVMPLASTDNIQSFVSHKELKRILTDVLSITDGEIGQIIQRFSGRDARWVWLVKEGALPKNTNASTTLTSEGVVITMLDYNKLKSATELSVARTIIHELVHAYLTLIFRYDGIYASQTYPLMVAAWGAAKVPDYNEIQHSQMEASFVNEIAAGLKAYAERMNLSVDEAVYFDLARAGLDFKNDKTLSEVDKKRIQLRIRAEQLNETVCQIKPVGVIFN